MMNSLHKKYRTLEVIFKGVASHRRVEILHILDKTPNQSVFEISEKFKIDFRTVSQHIRRMVEAGLVMKRSDGKSVRHTLTHRGSSILTFCRTLE